MANTNKKVEDNDKADLPKTVGIMMIPIGVVCLLLSIGGSFLVLRRRGG